MDTPETGTMTICGSYGTLKVCRATGNVLEYDPGGYDSNAGFVPNAPEYADIARFNIGEYQTFCREHGLTPSEDTEDILWLGFWTTDGSYEPPCDDARQWYLDEAARLN